MNIKRELAYDQIKVISQHENDKKIFLHLFDVTCQKELKVILYLTTGDVGFLPITDGGLDKTWHFPEEAHFDKIENYIFGGLAADIVDFIYDYYYSIPKTIFE